MMLLYVVGLHGLAYPSNLSERPDGENAGPPYSHLHMSSTSDAKPVASSYSGGWALKADAHLEAMASLRVAKVAVFASPSFPISCPPLYSASQQLHIKTAVHIMKPLFMRQPSWYAR